MKWYDKLSIVIIILLLLDMAVGVARFIQKKTEPQPQKKTGQIVEKFMAGDQHFLQLTIMVSPEEYIGYDIGDEYEVLK